MLRRPLLAFIRFFPKLEEWLMSALPSSLSYEPIFKERFGLGDSERLICVVLLAAGFAGVLAVSRVQKRRKALAEVLATGYHINFVEHLDRALLVSDQVRVNGADLRVRGIRLTLPRSTAELRGHLKALEALALKGLLVKDVPFGGRTVHVRVDGAEAEVHDWPRTLGSLPEYLDQEGDLDASGEVPAKYYRWFAQHLKKLKRQRINRYERFSYVNILGHSVA